MAAGIVATIVVALLALAGQTLTSSTDSFDRFETVRAYQAISSQFQMLPWDRIDRYITGEEGRIYFDDVGRVVDRDALESSMVARILDKGGLALPGEGGGGAESDAPDRSRRDLRQITIEVSTRPLMEDPFSDSRHVRRFSLTLVQLDQER